MAEVRVILGGSGGGTPDDNSVTNAKLVNSSVSGNKISANSILLGHLATSAQGVDLTTNQSISGFKTFVGGVPAGLSSPCGDGSERFGSGAGFTAGQGKRNTYLGYYTGFRQVDTNDSTLVGYLAGANLVGPGEATAIGSLALSTASSAGYNSCAVGFSAGRLNNANNNTFIGHKAGAQSTGQGNTLVGELAGGNAPSAGQFNVCLGYGAGYSMTGGNNNTLVGTSNGEAISVGDRNASLGYYCFQQSSSGIFTDCAVVGYNSALVLTGNKHCFFGSQAGDSVTSGIENIIFGYNSDVGVPIASNCIIVGTNKTGSLTNNDLLIETPDVGIARVAAGVITPTNGARSGGWIQNVGYLQTTANVTNATTTMGTVTGLSVPLVAGRKYSFKLILFVSDSTAADGVKVDFDGGTATMTTFRAHGTVFDTSLLLSSQTSAIATDFVAAVCTGDSMVEIHGSMTVNVGGTFIVQAAQNAHTTGTLTVYKGSHLTILDMP